MATLFSLIKVLRFICTIDFIVRFSPFINLTWALETHQTTNSQSLLFGAWGQYCKTFFVRKLLIFVIC
jgi:hypothetical protein